MIAVDQLDPAVRILFTVVASVFLVAFLAFLWVSEVRRG